jgi:hypothetical protein
MKRSHAVVAVLAAAAVGGSAYSMMPSERCQRAASGAPLDPTLPACRSSSGSGGTSGYHSSRSFFGSSNSGSSANAGGARSGSATTSAGTARGGFGASAGAIGGAHGGS